MKKFFTLAFLLCICAMAQAQSTSQVRIYINPGHGSWGGEDRHMGTVTHGGPTYTDTAGFYESNTNLEKGFGMLEKLIEYGIPFDRTKNQNNSNAARRGAALDLSQTNLVMSRVKNGPYPHDGSTYGAYSRNLSEIAAECESWNADMMISIHSNAATEGTTTNYPLFLYRGYTGSEQNAGSTAVSKACWPHWWKNQHMMWTYYSATNMNVQGDWTFASSWGTQGYGILRHSVPGFLVEGYFHTYQPARHKAMNWDACRWEGQAYAKGFNDYFGWGKKDSYGTIYGVLRDAEKTFTHTYYTPNTGTLDKYLPINNATVTLKNDAGAVVATYTTDDEYNGVFVFNKVAPGTYTLVYSHPDYKDATEQITVKANETVFPTPRISTTTETIAVQGHYAYNLSMTNEGENYTLKFKSTGAVNKGFVILTNTSTGATQSVEIGAIKAGENTVTIKASDLGSKDKFSWAISLENPKSTGIELIHSDNSIVYNNGTNNARIGLAIDKDETSANFGTIYTMTAMGQGLQRYNPDLSKNGSKILTNLFGYDASTSTSANRYIRSNRMVVNNGKVYIANYAAVNSGVWVYNPSGSATATNILNSYYERNVAFSGTGSSRVMYVGHESSLNYYNIGTSDSWSGNATSPSGSFSINMINGDGDLVMTDKGFFAAQNRYSGNNSADVPVFKFVDKSGSVLFNSSSLSSYLTGSQCGGMAITSDLATFAIVDGYSNPADIEVDVFSVSWGGNTPSFIYQYSIPLSGTQWVDQMAFDHAGNLYIASREKGLLVYTIKNPARQTITNANKSLLIQGVVEPAVQGHFAYGLEVETAENAYTLKFKSTGAVDNASLVLTNISTGWKEVTSIGTVVAGENSYILDRTEMPADSIYNWAIALDNPASPSVELVHSDNSIIYNNGTNDARIGVTIDKDETSANFGTIYTMTAMGQGLQRYNPDLSKNGSKILTNLFGYDASTSTSSNRYIRSNRMVVNNGKVYIANYAAVNSGVWIFDPNAGTNATQMLTTEYQRAVAFIGSGSSRVMYSYNENGLKYYNIGTADTWAGNAASPSGLYSIGMINADGDLLATDKGLFASQHRYSGNNSADVPCFVFVNKSGTVLYKSDVLTSLSGSERGGMAISDDLSTFVIVDAVEEGSSSDISIDFYKVAWNGETPSLSYSYSIKLDGTKSVDQMVFDHAGNLYIASAQKGLLVYAVKTNARQTITNALSTSQLTCAASVGIESISTDESAPAVYYNLQGVKVDGENIAPGTYIKVQGGKASKVLVK